MTTLSAQHEAQTPFLPCASTTPKSEARSRTLTESLILSLIVATITTISVSFVNVVNDTHSSHLSPLAEMLHEWQRSQGKPLSESLQSLGQASKRLIFYNRPPKTGSTTVRVAMKIALDKKGMVAAKCFNMIEWNEMGLRTIINRRDVDFYGCHTKMDRDRYLEVSAMRGGNVVFMTTTRSPEMLVLSSYLQDMRDKDFAKITDEEAIEDEVRKYREWFSTYPIDGLYKFHGNELPLTKCPVDWGHVFSMRRIAERFEMIVDVERPEESAAMVELVTGLKPDFTVRYNERTTDLSSPCLAALAAVNTSERSCGNTMVHEVLTQQFNIIKDRMMQNRCLNEDGGTPEFCDKVLLTTDSAKERSRNESIVEGERLRHE